MTTTGMSCQSAPSAQFVEKLEPVHLRHHQVENDHVGPRGGERINRNLPVLRLGHLPSDRLQRLAHAATDHFVIIDQKGAARELEPQMLVSVSTSLIRSTGFTR